MKISVLIPCHNEELTITSCVESVLSQTRKADQIIVVDDGSTDDSLKALKRFKNKIQVVHLKNATGSKSRAQEEGLTHVTGDLLITTDADTTLDPDFINTISREFADNRVVASAGYVKSTKHNWLTSCRQIDYVIGQEIHKVAQAHLNAVFVIPGCAGAYRTSAFKKHIGFDHDTLTEDLDFTYKHHKNDLKITFCKDAIVYTQDPSTLSAYIQQLRRWNAGNWQNLLKHYRVMEKPGNALEMSLMYLEGLVFPFLLLVAFFFNFRVFLLFSVSYLLIITLFAFRGAIKDKRWDIVLHVPAYVLVSFLHYAIFIEQFFWEVLFRRKNLVWVQPTRRGAIS